MIKTNFHRSGFIAGRILILLVLVVTLVAGLALVASQTNFLPKAQDSINPLCQTIDVRGNTPGAKVAPGERLRLEVRSAAGIVGLKYHWSVSSSGAKGQLTSTYANPVLWTAPDNVTAGQTWTFSAQVSGWSRAGYTCSKTVTARGEPGPTVTPTVTPTPVPSANLFKNSGFENGIIASNNQDLDPIDWQIKEGLFRIDPVSGETGDLLSERPRMIQVVGATNGVNPRSGNYMLKNATQLGLKSQFRQNYSHLIESGTFVQKLSLYIPKQNGFYQQMEFRHALESFHLRWSNTSSHLCWKSALEDNAKTTKGFCKDFPPLSYDSWHDYVITLAQQPGQQKWKVTVMLDGKKQIESNGNTVPYNYLYNKAIGQIFIGDECQQVKFCDGFGTIYFDDIESYN